MDDDVKAVRDQHHELWGDLLRKHPHDPRLQVRKESTQFWVTGHDVSFVLHSFCRADQVCFQLVLPKGLSPQELLTLATDLQKLERCRVSPYNDGLQWRVPANTIIAAAVHA